MWQSDLFQSASPGSIWNFGIANATQNGADTRSLLEQIKQGDLSELYPLIQNYVVPAMGAIVVMIVAYFAARILARLASSPVRNKVDETLGRFVQKLVFYSVMLFAVLGVLGMFGISVASFAAVLASAGFAIGLAFQGSLSNFSAGVLLLVFRPFTVGDVIGAAGITAKVYEIDLFSTTFDTPDNRRIIVPNSSILSGTIENHSYHDVRRVDVEVGVDYAVGLDKTREVLMKAANSLEDLIVDGEGRGCTVVLSQLADSAVVWKVRTWTRTEDYWNVKELLTTAVKNQLDLHGIGIPFPQLDVHLSQPEAV